MVGLSSHWAKVPRRGLKENMATGVETGGTDFYRSEFLRREKDLAGSHQPWVRDLRNKAMACFTEAGFPTSRQEEWKYTNIAPILKPLFRPALPRGCGLPPQALSSLPFRGLSEMTMVFVNGYYCPELSAVKPFFDGVKVSSLADSLKTESAFLEPYLGRFASYEDHAFVALNTAFMEDGAWVRVPKNTTVEKPIHLLFLSTASGEATVSYPRNLIVVGENSQVTIVESYYGLENEVYLTNAVTEIIAGENAVIEHYKLEWENAKAFHLETVQVQQGRQSQVTSYSVALGGALVRNEVNDVLDGEGAGCALYGLYLVDGQRFVDNHTKIDHVKPHTTSRELYKGALDGKGRAVFNGQIVVHPFASGTDAKQTNKNLLLSRGASVNSKPQLEISNNDVKCTHGSTIGQLDAEALFYLRSRGIEREEARRLLTYAFASEIVRSMSVGSVRESLDRMVRMDLPGEKGLSGL